MKWEGANKFPLIFPCLIDLAAASYRRRRHLLSSSCEFFGNRCREHRAVLRGVSDCGCDCCPHVLHLLTYQGETEGKGPALSALTAHSAIFMKIDAENSVLFLIGLHEVTLVLVPLKCVTVDSKERLAKVCVLRHTFARSLCCATPCRCQFAVLT